MPELALRCTGETLEVTFEGHQASVPLSDISQDETMESSIYDDAVAYGKNLFQKVFSDESLRQALTSLRLNERLVLVCGAKWPETAFESKQHVFF